MQKNGWTKIHPTIVAAIIAWIGIPFTIAASALPPADLARLQACQAAPQAPIDTRLEWISRQFLGTPYVLFSLGEGPSARFDQRPLYRLDQFDCETFVTSMLALTLSLDAAGYEQCLTQLRYEEGQIAFLKRHHFTSIDWNTSATQHGFLKDITPLIIDEHQHPVFQVATTEIDKAAWYQHLPASRIHLIPENTALAQQRLAELRQLGHAFKPTSSALTYLPLSTLFNPSGDPNMTLFNQIPNGSILEIVRLHWPEKEKIGTYNDISHIGLIFRHDHQLWFRHASPTTMKVVEQPLIPYLRNARTTSSIGGIHLQTLAVDAPSTKTCSPQPEDRSS